MAPVFHQDTQQLLLGFGQLHRPAVPVKLHPVKIKPEGPRGQHRR